MDKNYYRDDFMFHEIGEGRNPLEKETSIYMAVASGDLATVEEFCNSHNFTNMKGVGILSDNPLQNMRYHFVIATAMITRFCVREGLSQDTAYGMSDYHIRRMDLLKTIAEIEHEYNNMCFNFCDKMQSLNKDRAMSRNIVKAIDYIHTHIHTTIHMDQLAEHIGVSTGHFSRLFLKEMGMSPHDYIIHVKIEKAKNLLCYSNYSLSEIASYLAFSSESHFISVFKKIEGQTPSKYRNNNFRETWNS